MITRVSKLFQKMHFDHAIFNTSKIIGFTKSYLQKINWELIFLLAFLIIAPFLSFYNLERNPRPWHDEGFSLSISKTLVDDGVYAARTSDGYQSFGGVQSVGPTVLLPVALSFKLFGVGLFQGRIISASYTLITLLIFLIVGWKMFGRRTALLSIALLLGSPAVGFLLYGRQVLGEVPALGFLLAGWLIWSRGVRTHQSWHSIVAGLLIGAAMITKSQYMLLGFGTLILLAILDLFYYHQGNLKQLVIITFVAGVCVAVWYVWQIKYFGINTFQENSAKLLALANVTVGFNLRSTIEAFRFLLGAGSGYFYFFFGWLGIIYAIILTLRRNQKNFTIAFLVVFSCLWLGYFTFWIIPWSRYIFPAAAITAFFVGKLFNDLLAGLAYAINEFWTGLRQFSLDDQFFSPKMINALGLIVAVFALGLGTLYQFQNTVRSDVVDKIGQENAVVLSPPDFKAPEETAAFIDKNINQNAVIESLERELDILTVNHTYHFPDAALLAKADTVIYRGGSGDYALGADYFNSIRPSYVIIGWYARFNQIYDQSYIDEHSDLIATIGTGDWQYDIYRMHSP